MKNMRKYTRKRLKLILKDIKTNFSELLDYIIYYDSISEDLKAWDIIYAIEGSLEHLTEIELLISDVEARAFPLKASLLYNGLLYALVNNDESKEVLINVLRHGEYTRFKTHLASLNEHEGRDCDLNVEDVLTRIDAPQDDYGNKFYFKNAIWINCLGEPFYLTEHNGIIKFNPETGEEEATGLTLDEIKNDSFWSAETLKSQWESKHGPVPNGAYLLPITPFVLGGEFDADNLMAIPAEEAFRFYSYLREQLNDLPDGAVVQWGVEP